MRLRLNQLRRIIKEAANYDPLGDAGVPHVGVRPEYALAFIDASYGDRRMELAVKAEDAELARKVMNKMRKQGQVSGVRPTRYRFHPSEVTTREDLMRMLSEADLTGAYLTGADLGGASMKGAILPEIKENKQMKITKRQLKRIIREEKQKLLKEYGTMNKSSMSPLVSFAQAYAGLGDAVQSQLIDLVNAYVEGRVEDAAYEMNLNALDLAFERLRQPLSALAREGSDDAMEMMDAMERATEIAGGM